MGGNVGRTTVGDEQSFRAQVSSLMRQPQTLRGGQLASYPAVWQGLHVRLGVPQHWEDVLQWLQGFPGILRQLSVADKALETHHARKVHWCQSVPAAGRVH